MSKLFQHKSPKQLASKLIIALQARNVCSEITPSITLKTVASLKATLTTGERFIIVISEGGYAPRFLVGSVVDLDLEKRFDNYKEVVRFLKGRI